MGMTDINNIDSTNLISWWRADLTGSVSTDFSGNVINWTDQITGYMLASPWTYARPTYQLTGWTSGSTTKPCLTFDGVGDRQECHNLGGQLTGETQPYTVVVVYQPVTSSALYGTVWALGHEVSPGNAMVEVSTYAWSTGSLRLYVEDDAGYSNGSNEFDSVASTSKRTLGVKKSSSKVYTVKYHNLVAASKTLNLLGAQTIDDFSVAARFNNPSWDNYYKVKIAEIAVWKSCLSSSDMQSALDIMQTRWDTL